MTVLVDPSSPFSNRANTSVFSDSSSLASGSSDSISVIAVRALDHTRELRSFLADHGLITGSSTSQAPSSKATCPQFLNADPVKDARTVALQSDPQLNAFLASFGLG